MNEQPKDNLQYSDEPKPDPSTVEKTQLPSGIKLCPKCGGVMFDCKVSVSSIGVAMINVEPNDKRMLDGRSTEIRGVGCGVCGYLELYARFPAILRPNKLSL